ncbi:MAG: hypothetical protein ACKPFA_28595, partial [Dolichospermum sp.]
RLLNVAARRVCSLIRSHHRFSGHSRILTLRESGVGFRILGLRSFFMSELSSSLEKKHSIDAAIQFPFN